LNALVAATTDAVEKLHAAIMCINNNDAAAIKALPKELADVANAFVSAADCKSADEFRKPDGVRLALLGGAFASFAVATSAGCEVRACGFGVFVYVFVMKKYVFMVSHLRSDI
jgi:hypothetical protein